MYRAHSARLGVLPAVDIKSLPELNAEIQASIRKMNNSIGNEDIDEFKTQMAKVEKLYGQAVALLSPKVVNVKIYSEVLNCHIWLTPNKSEAQRLKESGVVEAIFTHDEVAKLKGSSQEYIHSIHAVKVEMPETYIKESMTVKDLGDTKPEQSAPADELKPLTMLPCLDSTGVIDYRAWHACKSWKLKCREGVSGLQRLCLHSGDWCLRLYLTSDKPEIGSN